MQLQLLRVVAAGAVSGMLLSPPAQAARGGGAAQAAPVCIAVVLPSVHGVEGSAAEVAASVRELFISFLTGPSLSAISLDARLASQAAEEARQKECGRVLSVALTRKPSGGGGGWLGRAVGQAVGQAGTSGGWGTAGGSVGSAIVRGVTVAATQAISELAVSTRARDEMRIEYRLTSLEGKDALGPKTDKAKARADGEDLLTPLVAKAAEAIAAAVSR